MEEVEEFVLRPTISSPDKEFKNRVGVDVWERMKSKSFRDNRYKCQGCNFEPYDVEPTSVLDIHLVEEDVEAPENSIVRTTCKFCHIVEHADVAISLGYVELVNSHFSQGELINICRNGALSTHIEDGDIRYLKKTLPEYLEELKSGRALEGKVKFIFTKKFMNTLSV